jgi:hypothetical protein
MGVHWVDIKSPEFNGQKFTDAFIYGFYHGSLTFIEPMITISFLSAKPDFKLNIKQPEAFKKAVITLLFSISATIAIVKNIHYRLKE